MSTINTPAAGEAISIGPSLETLEDTPAEQFVEIEPTASKSEETPAVEPEVKAEETPAEGEPEAETDPLKMAKPEAKAEGEEPEAKAEGEEAEGEAATFTVDTFTAEYAETGELSEESYAKLAENGLPKEFVDAYIEGQEALQAARGAQVFEMAGGEENLKAVVAWGRENLDDKSKDAFDDALNSAIVAGDSTALSMMLPGLRAQMAETGEPQYVSTVNGQTEGAIKPFETRSDMAEAMRDPRYGRDGDYVRQVQERLRISTF